MRNTFGSVSDGNRGFGTEFDPESAERAASTDQLSVVWTAGGEVIAASPLDDGVPGSFGIDVARLTAGPGLTKAINSRRVGTLALPPLSAETSYLTTVADYSERTRILALDGERLALDDDDLLEWLLNAEREMTLGSDGHPVFETPLEDTACAIRRLPNGQVSVTEVPRQYIQALGLKVRSLAGENRGAYIHLTIETPLRCAARYFLTVTQEGKETLRPGKGSEVTAFLLLNKTGYGFGLWSPQTGLFTEYAFLAPDEVRRGNRDKTREPFNPAAIPAGEGTEEYVRHAFQELLRQMSPEKLSALQLSSFAQIVWVAEAGLSAVAAKIAGESAASTGLDFITLNKPADEVVASGLLLGSHSFGDITVAGAQILPPVDLAHDLLVKADREEIERSRLEESRRQARRNKAVFTVLAAPVMVIACLLALMAGLVVSYFISSVRENRADARTQELKPALECRRAYESNLKWYQEFVSEVSQLRKQQPVAQGLLYEFNSNYPFNLDPSFYISELKLSPKGDVEMKGMARSKDAIASFLKSLEFASGAESGSRVFNNLTYEVQEVAPQGNVPGQVKLPAIAGSTLGPTGAAAPGVINWSIKGVYAPVAEFAPKPPAAKNAANPQPAPAQAATPAAPQAAR